MVVFVYFWEKIALFPPIFVVVIERIITALLNCSHWSVVLNTRFCVLLKIAAGGSYHNTMKITIQGFCKAQRLLNYCRVPSDVYLF